MRIEEIFSIAIGGVITIYFVFVLITQFSQQMPSFTYYGWILFAALIVGFVLYFKEKLFDN